MKISICIPAFKRIEYLQKLLESIDIQSFRDFQVVITDDSNDSAVKDLAEKYLHKFPVIYQKNPTPLGTPENWNEAIRKATGDWIKLMHDDDWFADRDSLKLFYEATIKNPECAFFFSAYRNISKKSENDVFLTFPGRFLLNLSPLNLFKKQYIGNPSCTLIKRDLNIFYDKNFKWVVDFEYYIRCLRKKKNFFYINKPLINIGVNDEQVTNFTFRNPEVEIFENHVMIEKMGVSVLRNIFVYDYYWRLYRNLKIRNVSEIKKYYQKSPHPLLRQMINFQNKIPASVLQIGAISKILMSGNYLISLFRKI